MRLILSSGSPWDCNYCNESGQVLFKAAPPPGRFHFGVNVTISRVVPPSRVRMPPRGVLEPIGEFHSNIFKETRIKYRGDDQPVKQFFRKTGSIFSAR
jgi:hypothetical protein